MPAFNENLPEEVTQEDFISDNRYDSGRRLTSVDEGTEQVYSPPPAPTPMVQLPSLPPIFNDFDHENNPETARKQRSPLVSAIIDQRSLIINKKYE